MAADVAGGFGIILILLFIGLDILMWIVGIRSIRTHRENSPFKNPVVPPTQNTYDTY